MASLPPPHRFCLRARVSRPAHVPSHTPTTADFRPVNLLLPIRWWARFAPLLLGVALLTATVAVRSVLVYLPGTFSRALVSVACAAISGGALAVGQWARSRTAFRARAFAPVLKGDGAARLVAAVHARAAAEARALGFAFLVINEDIDSPLICALRKGKRQRSPTSFWQKIPGLPPHAEPPPELRSDMLFDPRDM